MIYALKNTHTPAGLIQTEQSEIYSEETTLKTIKNSTHPKPLKSPAFPKKKFKIILVDPPWKHNDSNANGKRGAVFKYPCMALSELIRLPIDQIADDDCAMFMWAVGPMLPEAFQLLRAWDFEYKNITFVWTKLNRKNRKPFFGLGHWTRTNTEYVLLATRGKPKRVNASVRQDVRTPIRAHSEKPNAVRTRIVQLMGDVPRIELFARHHVPGWSTWGNQVGKLSVKD